MHKSRFIQIGENRYRETHGFYYEDFVIGTTIEHRPGRTITETDNIWQSLICMNQHPIHIDSAYACKTEFKQLLVASPVTFAIVGNMTVSSLSAKAIANLGWDKVQLHNPVFVGDTLYAESQILHKRVSESRLNAGIITINTKGIKADGTLCITFERIFMVPFNGYAVDDLKKESYESFNIKCE